MSSNPESHPPSGPETSTGPAQALNPSLVHLATHPFLFRAWLFSKIPSALFSGLRIRELDAAHSLVTVPYKWFTRNPFRSTYFACLAMAAEMSTGILVMSRIYNRKPAISTSVIGMESTFTKKATGRTRFLCADGLLIQAAIEKAITTGEAQLIKARSIGAS